jgi:hypothetical protein
MREWGPKSCSEKSEPDSFVELSALRTARAVDVGVIGVDIAAGGTTKNPVLAGSRMKPALSHFGVNTESAQTPQQRCHISQNKRRNGHRGSAGSFWIGGFWHGEPLKNQIAFFKDRRADALLFKACLLRKLNG